MKNNHDDQTQRGGVTLRPTKYGDLDWVVSLERDDANAAFVDQWSEEEHQHAIDESNVAHLVIETNDANRARLGYVILVGTEDVNDSVHFRRIVVDTKGRGVGRQAVKWIKHYVFVNLEMHRLWLNVLEGNERAHALYLTEGFLQEGVSRDATKKGHDQYQSYLVMSMLAHEYSKREGSSPW